MIPTPDPDTYGQYARASLLADYVELLVVLNRQPVRRATVADFLADSSWDMELIQLPQQDLPDEQSGSMSEDIDEARDGASIVFEQMKERSSMLGCRYPFTIADDGGEVLPPSLGLNPESSPYVSLLMLTIAQAFDNVESPCQPAKLFEGIVTKVLRSRGLPSVGLAACRRAAGSFEEALRIACRKVGLKRLRTRLQDSPMPTTKGWMCSAISAGRRICGRARGGSSVRSPWERVIAGGEKSASRSQDHGLGVLVPGFLRCRFSPSPPCRAPDDGEAGL